MKNKRIILYILIVLIFLLIAFLAYNYFANYRVNGTNSANNTNIVNEVVVKEPAVINFKNYFYLLSENIGYNISTENDVELLHLYNNIDKWGANIRLIDKTKYEDGLFDDYDKLEQFIKNNITNELKNSREITLDNIKAVSFESFGEDHSYIYAFMQAYDNYEYEIILYDGDDKSMNYAALDVVINMLDKRVPTDEVYKYLDEHKNELEEK